MEKRSIHFDDECLRFLDGFCAESEIPKAQHVRQAVKEYAEKMVGGEPDDAPDAPSRGDDVREDDADPVDRGSDDGGRALSPVPGASAGGDGEADASDLGRSRESDEHDSEGADSGSQSDDSDRHGGAVSQFFRSLRGG